jgi:hypothetical protein
MNYIIILFLYLKITSNNMFKNKNNKVNKTNKGELKLNNNVH